jgi:4-amino-4-deoxy-L-arabinose transferase-like glycosyltransferase
MVFSVPLLVAIAVWGRALFGQAAGLMALALAAFSPTLLAHAPLATPDVPLTATGLIAVWLLWRGSHPLAWGAALGLALLAKVTALLFVPILAALALARAGGRLRPALRALAPGLATGWLVLHLGYGFEGTLDWQGKADLVRRIPHPVARAAGWVAAALVPRPYLNAVGRQAHVALSGWRNYLMGEVSTDGWPHYYLVALALKETIPFLLLLAAAAAALRLRRKPLRDEMALVLPFALFLAVFSLGRVQIGIRYLLPAFPFLFVFASRLVALPGRWRRPARAGVLLLLAAHAASSLRAGPDHIAYFNEIAGGPAGGYRYLADSNLDWGQNRTRARQWADEHGAAFDPAVPPDEGLVVVSANRLLGLTDTADRYRSLREGRAPVARVGANWLVFDLGR